MRIVKKKLKTEPEGPMPLRVYAWLLDLREARCAAEAIVFAIENELEGDPNAETWESEPALHVVKASVLDELESVLAEAEDFIPEARRLVQEWIERRREFKERLSQKVLVN